MAVVFLGLAIANLLRGPFEGEANHRQLIASMYDFKMKAGPKDRLLHMIGPKLMGSRGLPP